MRHWNDCIFYHVYPLGLCDAPRRNDGASTPVDRLRALDPWIDHIAELGANALYLGPVFESSTHGYDTTDYRSVDRRLGSSESLARVGARVHQKGIRLVLDGVFNHVGRDFWAFRDVRDSGERSRYCSWFHSLDFHGQSPFGDQFSYEGWAGHYELVKLNLANPEVKAYLFDTVTQWVHDFSIDGLRLDAADVIDSEFLRELSRHCRGLDPDFWLVGEVVHGDYRQWVNPETLQSVTNYECYKGLYSSHVDRNYFEIAWSLNRQFGPEGLYRGLPLYSFADNHDVDRVASTLKEPRHLFTLYCILFTMPGVPSVYYGSEWGMEGRKDGTDWPLRPALRLDALPVEARHRDLARVIRTLAGIRAGSVALRRGDYAPLHVSHEQLAFARRHPDQTVVVAVNASEQPARIAVALAGTREGCLVDLLNDNERFAVREGTATIDPVHAGWARIMELRPAKSD